MALPSRAPRRPWSTRLPVAALVAIMPALILAVPVESGVANASATGATSSAASSAVLVLRKGSTGVEVTRLQLRLHVRATGTFGSATVSAVRHFQRVHKIAVSGVVNATTWRKLVGFTSVAPDRRYGDRGAWVKTLQRDLLVTPVSGYFGPLTRAAVLAYQKQHRLTADGVVTGRMWALLGHGGTIPRVGAPTSRSKTRGRTCPVPGATFTDTYGAPRNGHKHKGVDMFKKEGASILAIETGTVVRAHWSGSSGGWTITLRGKSGAEFFYAHNEKNLVKGRQHVTVGDTIALMGDTGDAKGNPQLHFEYWPSGKEGAAVNPTPLVRSLC
jgi:peptidoglycan hydrolase-like protein with peptidoglycan-binding domain